MGNSQEEFAALIKSEIAKVGKGIKDAGVRARIGRGCEVRPTRDLSHEADQRSKMGIGITF